MIALTLVIVAIIIKTFIDPRTSTIKRVGSFQNEIEENISEEISKISPDSE